MMILEYLTKEETTLPEKFNEVVKNKPLAIVHYTEGEDDETEVKEILLQIAKRNECSTVEELRGWVDIIMDSEADDVDNYVLDEDVSKYLTGEYR